jgi:hypothetical protein
MIDYPCAECKYTSLLTLCNHTNDQGALGCHRFHCTVVSLTIYIQVFHLLKIPISCFIQQIYACAGSIESMTTVSADMTILVSPKKIKIFIAAVIVSFRSTRLASLLLIIVPTV